MSYGDSGAQVQCVMHFLTLPIEDQFLDDMEATAAGNGGTDRVRFFNVFWKQ